MSKKTSYELNGVTKEELTEILFEKLYEEQLDTGAPPKPSGSWKCMICKSNNVELNIKSVNGLTNLCGHVFGVHKNEFKEVVDKVRKERAEGQRGPMDKFALSCVSSKSKSIFKWINFVTSQNLPFDIVENLDYRAMCNAADPICVETLMK